MSEMETQQKAVLNSVTKETSALEKQRQKLILQFEEVNTKAAITSRGQCYNFVNSSAKKWHQNCQCYDYFWFFLHA
jgi:hypothetical protein